MRELIKYLGNKTELITLISIPTIFKYHDKNFINDSFLIEHNPPKTKEEDFWTS